MRILQIILSRGFRGAERHVAELAAAQSTRHDMRLVLRRDCADADGVSIRSWLPGTVRATALAKPFWGLQLATAVRAFRPDVVHAHGGRAARLVSRWVRRVPRLATIHLDYRARAYGRLDAIMCVNDSQAAQAARMGFRGAIARIDHWHTPHRKIPPDEIAALRAGLGAGPATFVVGAVGQLAVWKGFDRLIDAFRNAAPADAVLAIAGDGEERAALAARASGDPRIRLLGFRKDVRDLYQAFDLFVSPSRAEAFGLVFLEALDAGVPIVATRTEGAAAVLTGFPATLVENPDDTAGLARALAAAAATRPPRYVVDLSRFSREARMADIDAFYARMIARRAARQ